MTLTTLYSRYIKYLDDPKAQHDFQNALIRYAVVAMGGPQPSASKRAKLSAQDIETALKFLARQEVRELADILNFLKPVFDAHDCSQAQRERVRRSLRMHLDWARANRYLPDPDNPIPTDLCKDIPVGPLEAFSNQYSTRHIIEQYLEQLDEESRRSTQYTIIRHFVPGCGGPVPQHYPLWANEIEAGLLYLEKVPLEYLQEALTIATQVVRIYHLREAQETRTRRRLRALLEWARQQGYLPYPEPEPMPEYPDAVEPPVPIGEVFYPKGEATALECFHDYRLSLSPKSASAFQSVMVRYAIPALGGPQIAGTKAQPDDIQAALDFLERVPLEVIQTLMPDTKAYLDTLDVADQNKRSYLSQIKTWLEWAVQEGYFGSVAEPTITFRTFSSRPVPLQPCPSGQAMNQNQAPVHKLGAKIFPNDYINDYLAQQIQDYRNSRANKRGRPVTKGSLDGEVEKILQMMGWLHRYEGLPLEDLCFETLISVSQLKFRRIDYESAEAYNDAKLKGEQLARDVADQDIERLHRYLDFTGGKAASQQKRVSVAIAMAKFLFRDLLETDDFPTDHYIPILMRLLKLQALLKGEAKTQPATIKYHEKAVAWSDIVYAMEMQRRRVEQTTIYIQCRGARLGYLERKRPDTAIAQQLQRFLALAFHVVFPSRPRSFYDLRIGETFVEGILLPQGLLLGEAAKSSGQAGDLRFYIHHGSIDYKSGRAMSPVLLNNDGYWFEFPNLQFGGNKDLYGYIRQWLEWGRIIHGPIDHHYFFRKAFSNKPIPNSSEWSNRIKNILARWTGVEVPPTVIRKVFTGQFPEHREAGALLLQHSEARHTNDYDMRISVEKMKPVVDANVNFINQTLMDIPRDNPLI